MEKEIRTEVEPQLTANAIKVLERRYLIKDENGKIIETPKELFWRVAKALAAPDAKFGATGEEVDATTREFYEMMANLEFTPNSPTMMNAGRPLGQLSACFVLPVEDTMESIFDTVKHAALIHKSGGGTGFSFARLRPKGSMVASTSGVASGPVSFMKVVNAATEAVKQGGTRRGANMGMLRVDHPDILDFITVKDDLNELINFNISVVIPNEFMEKVEKDQDYDLIDPRTRKPYLKDDQPVRLNARKIFRLIVEHAWKTGEPGVMFVDKMNEGNPSPKVALYEATNPCGEQPLLPYESCNLGSLNLSRMLKTVVDASNPVQPYKYEIDWDKLEEAAEKGVHFLDNVIEANKYPLSEIDKWTKDLRKIGLGVMGWADMLSLLEIPYDSEAALRLGEEVMSFIKEKAHSASRKLAEKRGVFPLWKKSVFCDEEKGAGVPIRNSTVTTIAPAGTISIIAGCSSGIEPVFAVSYVRNVMDNTKLVEVSPHFEKKAKERGFYSEELMQRIAQTGSVAHIPEVPEDIKRIFVTSHDIKPEWHIQMQAVFQKFTDNAVSKTINLAEEATVEDVETAYWMAYKLNCKGVTVYRDGCRKGQVLSFQKEPKKGEDVTIKERPDLLQGFTEKIRTGYGNLYVTVNTLNGKPFEVFAQIGKSGYTTMADTEAVCRLISLAFRSGVKLEAVVEQLVGIGGASQICQEGGIVTSIPDAIAKVLKKHFINGKNTKNLRKDIDLEICPDCGGGLVFKEGCLLCQECGFSRC